MPYSKTTWVDRNVQFPNRFTKSNESGTSVDLAANPGTVTNAGTPLSAANLNKIENGIANALEKSGDTMTGVLNVTAGTVTAPAIAPTSDSNTGIFFPAADTVAIGEGGTEVLRINSSGNVGIGTTNPTARLEVNGGAYLKGNLSLNLPYFTNRLLDGTTTTPPSSGGTPFNALNLLPSTYSEQVKRVVLVYKGNDGWQYTIRPENFTSKTFSNSYGQGYYIGVFDHNGVTWVQDGGWVIVGYLPANAGFNLTFPDSNGGTTKASSGSQWVTCISYVVVPYDSFLSIGGFNVIDTNFSKTVFSTNATERMRIDSAGNVGIGTTNPTSKLTVVGDIYADGGGIITATGGVITQTLITYSDTEINQAPYSPNHATNKQYVDNVSVGSQIYGYKNIGGAL
jgi:hypothetical protein